MPSIAPRPEYIWDSSTSITDNIAALIQEMEEAEDIWGDPLYDYYSVAHWILVYIQEQGR